MQKLVYIFLLLLGYNGIAQNNNVIIKGTVVTNNNEPVENAEIHLKLSGGYTFSHHTDTAGNYAFKFEIERSSSCMILIATTKNTISKTFKNGFLTSKDVGKQELQVGTSYIKDFMLTPVSCGPEMPSILFNTNAIVSCNDSLNKTDPAKYQSLEQVVNQIYQILKDNPSIVLEFLGHASTLENKHAEAIALYRAQLLCELIAVKGIDRKRLKAKGYGNRKLLITDLQIKKAQTPEEKTALHVKNQRVTFRIVNWDFKE